MSQQFTIKVQEYYKGSFYDPEGFKGIMPGATSEELTQICSQAPADYPGCMQEQPQTTVSVPTVLPSVGADYTLAIAIVVSLLVAYVVTIKIRKG